MSTNFFARPLIPILIAFIAGIFLGDRFPGYGALSIAMTVLGIAFVGWRFWRSHPALVSPMVLFIALGYLSVQPWTAPDFPSRHVIHHADNTKAIVEGVITEAPLIRPNGLRLIVEAVHLKALDGKSSVSGRILVSVGDGEPLDLKRGDRIRFQGRLKRVYGFHNPGGFNYERYLSFQKIWCRMWVSPKRVTLLDRSSAITLAGRIDALRHTIGRGIDKSVSGETGQVLKALVIGDRSGILPPLREIFNRTGTGHLLAISGLHIGIVATVAYFLFRWLLGYSGFLLRRAWAGKAAALLTFFPVITYGVMSGMSPSTQRALVMVAVFLLAYLAGKLQDAFNTLAVAGLIILAVHPPALFSISFQLSFSAVAFIILGISRPWPQERTGAIIRRPILKKAGSLVLGTILATLGTLPLVMQTFNEISLIGVGTNLLAVPLVGFAVVPAGLLGMFIQPVSTFLATTCFRLAGGVLDITLAVIHFLADWSSASLKTFTPSAVEIGLYYVLVTAAIMLAPKFVAYLKGQQTPVDIEPVRVKLLYGVLIVAAAAVMADGTYWAYQRFGRNDLRVTVIDVGSGSAALVEFPRGPVMLIDGGGFSDNAVFDVGARVVAPLLWRRKIMTVDTIVLSHPNSDHLNGLIYIAEHFKVKTLWSNGQAADTESFRAFKRVVKKKRIFTPPYHVLPRNSEVNSAEVHILHPPKTFTPPVAGGLRENTNNHSMVVRVLMGDFSFLFPGDIEKEAEKELTELNDATLASTILIAPHHGSRTSSTPVFLDMVAPQTVIVSSARAGRYQYPHLSVLKRYQSRGYRLFNTAQSGAIQVITDGNQIRFRPTIETGTNSL